MTLGVVTLALLVTGALAAGDIWSRRSVTIIDAVIIGTFFVILGAATPVGDGVRWIFAGLANRLGG